MTSAQWEAEKRQMLREDLAATAASLQTLSTVTQVLRDGLTEQPKRSVVGRILGR